jgi:hypothetical protein
MTSPTALLRSAHAAFADGRLEEAEALYRAMLAAYSYPRVASDKLLELLTGQARWADVEAAVRDALARWPDDAALKLRLAKLLLADGRYAEGWPLYEARRGDPVLGGAAPNLPSLPEWDGGAVQRLLVWPERGFGDTLQFARLLPELERRGVRASLASVPALAGLLGEAGVDVVPIGEARASDFTAWTPLGSLPLRLGVTLDAVPPPLPLTAEASAATGGLGVVTRGRQGRGARAGRDLPEAIAAELLALPGAVSLARRDTGARDFRDTAELVAGLDHVITVDTAVAHLAGSMGKPTSLLLPAEADWRWLRERTDSPWYPSLRLYRLPAEGDWRAAVDPALGDLGELAAQPARKPARRSALAGGAAGEYDARRKSAEAQATDRRRWEDARQLETAWDRRAELAARYVPLGARVLDLGCGAMALEQFLPEGCVYIPCDLTARDPRTVVCDFNAGEFPDTADCEVITALGVLEYMADPTAFLLRLRQAGRKVVLSYNVAGGRGPADRRAQGWLNDLTRDQLVNLLQRIGFNRIAGDEIGPGQLLMCLTAVEAPAPERSVWILSYSNDGNFGDRLGVEVISGLLPPNARVRHLSHMPWTAPPDETPDLLVVGLGGSLFGGVLTPELTELVARAPRAIGLFGTQYRSSFHPADLGRLIDRLDIWWARYEEDALLYGRGRSNVRHMGDLMVDAFPMSRWTRDEQLDVGAEAMGNQPLDRLIQLYQAYRQVRSPRLHPLLCALTSAEAVAYAEQTELDGVTPTGKFRAMLMDIFGMEKPQGQFWRVDRSAVTAYKAKVRRNLAELSAQMAEMLA